MLNLREIFTGPRYKLFLNITVSSDVYRSFIIDIVNYE